MESRYLSCDALTHRVGIERSSETWCVVVFRQLDAFEGFDVGWYFLNSLMQYGPYAMGCLPYEHMPLLHTRYYFTKHRYEDGIENRFWNIYQYDSQSVELKPIWIYQEE